MFRVDAAVALITARGNSDTEVWFALICYFRSKPHDGCALIFRAFDGFRADVLIVLGVDFFFIARIAQHVG